MDFIYQERNAFLVQKVVIFALVCKIALNVRSTMSLKAMVNVRLLFVRALA
jgi:hypothetical protein